MARNTLECLLNEPVKINLGTKAKPDIVELREPVLADRQAFFSALEKPIIQMFGDMAAYKQGKKYGKKSFDAFGDSLLPLVAIMINRDVARVEKMTADQLTFVIEHYLELIGWQRITDRFQRATRNLAASAPKSGNDAAPSWLRPSSPTSAARSRD